MSNLLNYNNQNCVFSGFNTFNQNPINPIGANKSFKIYNNINNSSNSMNNTNIINIKNNLLNNPNSMKSNQEKEFVNRIKYFNESYESFIGSLPNFTKDYTIKILNQLKNNTCKICKTNGENGTGFFCKIEFANSILPVLITVNHVLNKDDIKVNRIIEIILIDKEKDKEKKKKIVINEPRITFTDEELDVTIIEIIPEVDGINNFLEVDEEFDEFNIKEKIYILQYPKGELSYSFGKLMEKTKNSEYKDFIYLCNTSDGSSGAPILNFNGKVIGVHKARENDERSPKIGTLIKFIVDAFRRTYDINKSKLNLTKREKEKGTEIKPLSDDDYYVGHYENGKIAIYYSDGKLKYEGDRVDGEFEGKGTYYYKEDGNRYEGEWKKGLKHGKGILYYKNFEGTKKRYEGYFSKGEFEGIGTYYWEDGNYYKGYFKNGKKHGYGIYCKEDGQLIYEGRFYNDKFEGKGVLYSNNDTIYVGDFKDGLKHGKGILYKKNGDIILKGKFEYNTYQGKK